MQHRAQNWLVLLAGLFLAGCHSGTSTADLPAVTPFDAARYAGRWYEIARLPHRFENGLEAVSATYTLGPGGTFKVVNRGVTAQGKIKTVTGRARPVSPDRGELEVSFFRPFWGAYKIIALDANYTLAVVTSSTRDYLWILARTPQIPPDELDRSLKFCRERGFAVERLHRVKPAAAQ